MIVPIRRRTDPFADLGNNELRAYAEADCGCVTPERSGTRNGYTCPAHRASAEIARRRVTHGRHCPCSACAQEDWSYLGPCGMHGRNCPGLYRPVLAGCGQHRDDPHNLCVDCWAGQ